MHPFAVRRAVALAVLLGPVFQATVPATASAPASSAIPAAMPPQHLRIVGGLAGAHQYTRHERPFWTQELPRLSGGRATATIVAYDHASIAGQEMLRLVQLGKVAFGTVLLGVAARNTPLLAAPDLPGLNPNMASLRRSVAAFRPYMTKALHERLGVELLALYVYPAQVTFCTRPFAGLADLAGRRVRVSSEPQADLVAALGGVPVDLAFGDIVASVRSGRIDCAITGTMSGHTLGLDEVMSQLDPMPINWGLAAFVANGAAWNALPGELQALLKCQRKEI